MNISPITLICPYSIKRPSMPLSTAVPDHTASLSIGVTAEAGSTSSTGPAATAIVPNASIIKAASGWMLNLKNDCPAVTSCSHLPCLNNCAHSAGTIRMPPMAPCSRPPQAPSKYWLKTPDSSAPICRVLPPSSIPGGGRCNTIPICISLSPPEAYHRTERCGWHPAITSICPSEPFPKSLRPSSKTRWQDGNSCTKSIPPSGRWPGTSTVNP